MKQHRFRKVLACLCSTALLSAAAALPASATSVGDVIAAAYAAGIPEQYIQEGIAMYGGGSYTSEQCDAAIASIYSYQSSVDSKVDEYLGSSDDSSSSSSTTTAQNNSSSNGSSNSNSSNSSSNGNSSSSNSSGNSNSNSSNSSNSGNSAATAQTAQGQTASATANATEEKSFVDMTMEEKIDYVNQMTAEERSDYLANLTTEERNSFIKQLPLSDKADVLNEFLSVGESLGLSFTVDEMTNDSVVISARDKDGKLVDVSAMGVTVEDTGKSYTIPIVIIALLAAGGISGVAALLFFAGKNKQDEDAA
jgi:cobalamin biosynthesis Mg chelatase CobN